MVTRWYAPSHDMALARGPFRPSHVKEGDRYEISNGHPVHVSPAGGRHGREHLVGARALASDPAVTEIGVDVGYELSEDTLRAPDISVGNVPDAPGWAKGAPMLAVEYADRGTDEDDLETKIRQLFDAGTKHVWVVRLVGPRRVDVHHPNRESFTVPSGGSLTAEGVLAEALPVDALFDVDRSNEVALRNLLLRSGYTSLQHLRDEARAEGLRVAVETACSLLDITLDEEKRHTLSSADARTLESLLEALRSRRVWP